MKRDMDLIREILLKIEERPFDGMWFTLDIDGCSPEAISYHVMLLHEAGLIEAYCDSALGSIDNWLPIRLTWQGHEFLDAARDSTRWDQAKGIMTKVGGFALEVLKAVLIESAKSQALAYLKTP